MVGFLADIVESGIADDATLNKNISHAKSLWSIREHIPVALMQASKLHNNPSEPHTLRGKLFKYDVSLDMSEWNDFIIDIEDRLEARGMMNHKDYKLLFCTFGHAAEQDVHLNILLTASEDIEAERMESIHRDMNACVYGALMNRSSRTSISAEHGIGIQKLAYLPSARSSGEVMLMQGLKMMMDPKNILNPGKVIRSDYH